jgi:hypothetical protein
MVARNSLILILLACMALTSCRSFASDTPIPAATAEETPLPETPASDTDYITQLLNAEYQLGAVDPVRTVQLVDGVYEEGTMAGGDYVSVKVADFFDKGDLDGEAGDEYVMLVSENYGGSGVFVFLTVYKDENGTPKFVTSRMIDDRPQISELDIQDDREIYLDAIIHGIQDPMCCPTLRTTSHYRLGRTGGLLMIDYTTYTPGGQPRTIVIESPKEYTEVFGSIQVKGNVTIAPFENNLVYRIKDVGGVELAAGPVTVTASEMGGPGTFDEVIELGDLLSGTAITLEVQDLSAADGSLLAMDSVVLVVQ